MDWITGQVAIGNFLDAQAENLSGTVDAVLCLLYKCCDVDHAELDILCLPLIDGPGNNPRYIAAAVGYINDMVSSGDRILVHCHAGRSRSVCVVAKYLMEYKGLSQREAVELIKSKREIYLSDGICLAFFSMSLRSVILEGMRQMQIGGKS